MGGFVYIFAGQQDFRLPDCISSFERLRLDEESKHWEHFMIPQVRALGYNQIMPLNDRELIILSFDYVQDT